MQNFTFGRKGTNWFLFAFVLLIGSLPSFGQEVCPTESGTDADQTFCYLQTVSDISSDGTNTAVYQTDDNVNDTQPIPGDELLTDGATYYVGGQSGSCDRVAVNVTVNSVAPPTNTIFPNSNSFSISPCSSTNFSASDLAGYFDAITGYEVVVYDSEFGTTPFNDELVPGESYFVGQVPSTGNSGCPSERASVGYDPNNPDAPQAAANQTFCEGSTVADLSASGTYPNTQAIRWYRSANASSPLPADTELINNQTYYASQVVNDRNSPFPPCESDERVAVAVTLTQGDAGNPNTGIICESEVQATFPSYDAIRNYYLSLLDDGVPTTGTFNPTPEQLAQQYQNDEDGLGDFTTTYTLGEDQCQASVQLTASIIPTEDANAGPDVQIEYAVTDPQQNLYDLIPSGINADGYFEGYPEGNFDPASEGSGVYDITYTVDESTGCIIGSDSAIYTITVTDCNANAGADVNETLCSAQVENFLNDPAAAYAYFNGLIEDGVDTSGDFTPSLQSIYTEWQADPIGTFTTTYTVEDGSCTDSADFTITVVEGDANAGAPNMGIVCLADVQSTFPSIDAIQNYYLDLLDSGVSRDGSFNPTPAQLADLYQNDADGLGDFTTTYTVGQEGACTASVDLTVRIVENVDAGENGSVTLNETDDPVNLFDYLGGTPDEGGTWSPGNGTFDPATDTSGDYTYTIGSGSCQESAIVSVTVNTDPTDPSDCTGVVNVGNSNMGIVCLADVQSTFPSVDEIRKYYISLLDAGVAKTGTLSPSAAQLADIYQNDADGLGDFTSTYTLTSGECSASVDLTVRIVESVDAGENGSVTLNKDDAPVNLFDYLGGTPDEGGTWTPGNGTFDPATDSSGDFTYTIGSESCEDSAVVSVSVSTEPTDPCEGLAGTDSSATLCESEVQDTFPSIDAIRNYYLNLLDSGVARTGTLNPTASQLATMYQNDEDGLGDFNTTYTLTEGECTDSVELTVSIIPITPANAGSIEDQVVCSNDADIDLYSLVEEGASVDGVFTDYEDGVFSPSENGAGTYNITYVVNEDVSCVTGEDSTSFTIEVNEAPTAGADVSEEFCITEVESMITTPQDAIDFFTSLVGDNVPQDGTFEPSLETLAAAYVANPIGTFETVYTVSNEECEDSANISLTINDTEAAEAGDDVELTFCARQAAQDLYTYLPENANPNGLFAGLDNGMFDPTTEGEFEITYTVNETTGCIEGSDSSTFTIQVNDISGLAGDDNSEVVCSADAEELFPDVASVRNFYLDMLDEGVNQNGTFSPSITDLIANYQENPIGDFETTYTVGEGECTDSAALTVSIFQSPNAGSDMDLAVCSNQDTIDLFEQVSVDADATGEFDLDGTVITDGLMTPSNYVAGTYTVTYTVLSDNEFCNDDTATFTVTISEAPATPDASDLDFCAVEMPTGADLSPAGDDLTWYSDAELNNMVADEDALEDGDYYVTQTNGTCESDATMITVTINDIDSPSINLDNTEFCEFDDNTIADLTSYINENADVTWYASEDGTDALPETTILENGVSYYAALIDETTGCESLRRLRVTIELEQCDLVFPEGISPNDDTMNDTFEIINIAEKYPNYTLQVYNRWGNLVYKGNASTPDWDGTSNQSGTLGDDVLPVGVYFYVVEFNDGETPAHQGKVYLSR